MVSVLYGNGDPAVTVNENKNNPHSMSTNL